MRECAAHVPLPVTATNCMLQRKPAKEIPNRLARRILLDRQGLAASPARKQSKADLLELVNQLGFVQLDSVATVERAHHMTLFARNQTYRRADFKVLLEDDRTLFENWTHDAAVIPTEFYPYWQRRFERDQAALRVRWLKWRREGFEEQLDDILSHVAEHGPTMARGLAAEERKAGDGWWDWHPSKTALEYLWRTGSLAVTRREAFQKVYDLTERVIPGNHRRPDVDDAMLIDWCCRSALDRLGIATPGELAAFWGIISPAEAKLWCEDAGGHGLPRVLVEPAEGSKPRESIADERAVETVENDIEPPARLRVISPFDPVVRDRKRLSRLFGFDYRIEIFVPAAKRTYGYYVFPLLEGDRFVGRIDMKRDREAGCLSVTNIWWEPGMRATKGRVQRLEAELARVSRFAGCSDVNYIRNCD